MKLRVLSLILVLIALFSLTACDFSSIVPEFESETPYTAPEKETEKATEEATEPETEQAETENALPEDGEYDSRDEVALYLQLYGHLPSNYITKKEA